MIATSGISAGVAAGIMAAIGRMMTMRTIKGTVSMIDGMMRYNGIIMHEHIITRIVVVDTTAAHANADHIASNSLGQLGFSQLS